MKTMYKILLPVLITCLCNNAIGDVKDKYKEDVMLKVINNSDRKIKVQHKTEQLKGGKLIKKTEEKNSSDIIQPGQSWNKTIRCIKSVSLYDVTKGGVGTQLLIRDIEKSKNIRSYEYNGLTCVPFVTFSIYLEGQTELKDASGKVVLDEDQNPVMTGGTLKAYKTESEEEYIPESAATSSGNQAGAQTGTGTQTGNTSGSGNIFQ